MRVAAESVPASVLVNGGHGMVIRLLPMHGDLNTVCKKHSMFKEWLTIAIPLVSFHG